jgi:hypothetical protein
MDRALRASAEIVPDPRDDRITELEAEVERLKDANMKLLTECDEQARGRGEAEGKLRASEMAGVVEGWKRRAETAEAALAKYQAVVDAAVEETEAEANLRRLADDSRLYEWPNKWQRSVDNAHGKRRAAVTALKDDG